MTTDTHPKPADKRNLTAETAFVNAVKQLYKDRKGDLAALRRNAGNTLAEARNVGWFYRLLPSNEAKTYEDNIHFLVATLLAHDRAILQDERPLEEGNRSAGNFGRTMALLQKPSSRKEGVVEELQTVSQQLDMSQKTSPRQKGVERRFCILLDASFDETGGGEMAFRLRQLVKLILSKKVAIDWPCLLHDLKYWRSENRSVQKQWARSFFAPILDREDEPENTLTDQP